ncbi:hypothetical protein EDI28_27045, partial [Photobacterium chitinilyticum]
MTLQAVYGNLLTHELEVEQRQANLKELKNKSDDLLSADPKSAGKSKLAGKSVIVSDDSEEEEPEANQLNVENELKNMNDSLALLTMRYKKFLRKPTFQGGALKSDGKKVFQEKESKT